jgi:acyl carrier protein
VEQTRSEVDATIRSTLGEVLPDQDISVVPGDANLVDSLGVDSLDLIEFVLELERRTGARVADEDLKRLTSIDAVVDYVCGSAASPA